MNQESDAPLLTLLRHGKAEPATTSNGDRDRALSDRGRRDIDAIARRSRLDENPPERILFSNARRTRETADCLREALSLDVGLFVGSDRLYLASLDMLNRIIAEQDDDGIRHLMIIGHNPGLEDLAMTLEPRLNASGWSMSTSAICRLARPGSGVTRILFEDRPA